MNSLSLGSPGSHSTKSQLILIDKVKFQSLRWLFSTELSQLQLANERSEVVAFGGPAVALSVYTQATPKSLGLDDYHCTMNSPSQ